MASGITWTVTYTIVDKDGKETPRKFTNADISTVRRHYRRQREEVAMNGGNVKNGKLTDSNGDSAPL